MTDVWIDLSDVRLEGVFTGKKKTPAVVITHPHPLYGGSMDNHVVMAVERAFRVKGFSSLRFNFRGTGRSTGEFDDGNGEVRDVIAAVNWVKAQEGADVVLAGYSFGSRINAQAVAGGLKVFDHVMVSPPVAFMAFDSIVSLDRTGLIVTGENDEIAPPDQISSHIDRWRLATDFRIIPGCDHFYSGRLKPLEALIMEYLDKRSD